MTLDFDRFCASLREWFQHPARLYEPDSEARFGSMALELFGLQYEHNAAYRRFAEARRATPEGVKDWTEIPAVPTAAFKEIDLTSLPPEQRVKVFHSSGTTGQRPSRHFHCSGSLSLYEESMWSWFRTNLLAGEGTFATSWRLAILTPPPVLAPHSSLVHMLEVVRRKCGADESAYLAAVTQEGDWRLDSGAAVRVFERASASGQPMIVMGTAFSFVHLLDWLAENRRALKLAPGSRALETGGYKGRSRAVPKAHLYSLLSERLGIETSEIVSEYGMSELSSQAYDLIANDAWRAASIHAPVAPHSGERVFRFPPWARARVVSPETGEAVAENATGLLRIFDLANVYSVLAVQTEDQAIRRQSGFEMVGRSMGAEPRGCSLTVEPS
jgi:hypothetical protein